MAWLFFFLSLLTPQTPTPVQAGDEKADQAQPAAFAIGALRRDGIVSPFAVFDGKHWSVPWPADLPIRERSLSPGRIPYLWWGKTGPLTEMAAWIDGVNRGIVHLTRPVPLRVMCEWRIGLVSDYHSGEPAVPPYVQPYPKDGLAVSGTQRVDTIETLSATSPEWSQTAGFIKEEFDKAEQAAARLYTQWKNPIPPSVRQSTPVEIEAMYRAPMDREGWVAYYVEGIKSYPPGPGDDNCGLVASAGGWMIVGPDGKRSIKLHGDLTYCDRRGVTYMLPLGLIKTAGKSYWAFQMSGNGREGYMVVRPTTNGAETITRYSAAFCPPL